MNLSKVIKSKVENNDNSLKLLDCTLRDGDITIIGILIYNLYKNILKVMSICEVDILELGFRSLINNKYKGPLAFTTDNFLEKIECKNIKIAVMINVKEFDNNNEIKDKIATLFPLDKGESKVDIVRLACTS